MRLITKYPLIFDRQAEIIAAQIADRAYVFGLALARKLKLDRDLARDLDPAALQEQKLASNLLVDAQTVFTNSLGILLAVADRDGARGWGTTRVGRYTHCAQADGKYHWAEQTQMMEELSCTLKELYYRSSFYALSPNQDVC